ncbi:MAG: hypothetical protein DIU63_09930 [Proteobacteria bacterium]|nr:MAG: hypothetical protein DIU63_09930 [Pseudomonadota bacterium]
MSEKRAPAERIDGIGWYFSFALIAIVAFVVLGAITGQEVLAAAVRVFWNAFAFLANSFLRVLGSLLGIIAKGVGWRRVTRVANVIAGVGLGYVGSVVLSDEKVQKARGWRAKLKATIAQIRRYWQDLPLVWKLVVVAILIASQVYLHTVLIVFPIAFLVPVVRRLWIQAADLLFGSWYWRLFGRHHRRFVAWLRRFPIVRGILGWARLTRIRYLAAWRLWKYHPRYFDPATGRRVISFVEPIRLWWRGELDDYIGRPLLAGKRSQSNARQDTGLSEPAEANGHAHFEPTEGETPADHSFALDQPQLALQHAENAAQLMPTLKN